MSLLQILLANLAILAGACLQGVAGYGIGTLAAPLLFLISPVLVPGPLILNATLLTVFMLIRNRGALQVREVRFAIGGGVAGAVLAALVGSVPCLGQPEGGEDAKRAATAGSLLEKGFLAIPSLPFGYDPV